MIQRFLKNLRRNLTARRRVSIYAGRLVIFDDCFGNRESFIVIKEKDLKLKNMPPLILTAKLDAESFGFFDRLRKKYFPPERNFLAAHVTLFHHLPAAEIEKIEADLETIGAEYQSFEVHFPTLRFLGKGTAAEIESAELSKIRSTLAENWSDSLTAQDKQKFKPHVTIQNKVAPDEAKKIFGFLQSDWKSKTGKIVGLQLWYYIGGPWELANEFLFADKGR